jgi:putative acetyltransferase
MEQLRRQAADLWRGWYADEVIEAWQSAARPALLPDSAARGSELFIIDVGAGPVAFGVIHVGNGVLEGLFVHPDHAGRGLGGCLLEHMLSLADDRACPRLEVEASLNAKTFYARHGFEETSAGALDLAPGLTLASVLMLRQRPVTP